MSVKRVLAAMAMLAAALPATAAITIDFEGLADGAPVGTNSLAAVAKYAGGQGNFINESSPNTAMFFLTGSALANVPAGFTGALSFYYSSEKSAVVNIYDGLNRTGNVIGSIALNAQSQQNNCDTPQPDDDFCNWTLARVAFAGVARSVDFGGTVNLVGYDNITFGVDTQDLDRRTQIDECSAGNPIYPTVGTKREAVDSLLRIGTQPLALTYDTTRRAPAANGAAPPSAADAAGFGELWLSSLHRKLSVHPSRRGARASRGDGRIVSFTGDGTGTFTAEADINDRLAMISGGGYRYIDAAGSALETYDSTRKLTSIAYAGGQVLTFTYSVVGTPAAIAPSPGYLIEVRDSFGRSLRFEYQLPSGGTTARISKIIDSAGQPTVPEYDANGNLIKLTWADNTVRQFVYDHADLPWALTGVVDERAIRKSTFDYDSQGRARSTEHAGGVNRYSVTYTTPPQVMVTESYDAAANILFRTHAWQVPQSPSVTSPNGSTSLLDVTSVLGQIRITGRSQPAGSGCAASTSNQSYDANGNVAVKDDFNGNRACYASDLTRNLETVRIEGLANTASCSALTPANAVLPAGSRKVTTEWHPDWRLKTKWAEPGKLTTRVYNGRPDPFNGDAIASCAPATALLPDGKPIAVLCKQVEQATTDVDGRSGFGAALQAGVAIRQTHWTYNEFGHVLTEDGPRTDVNDITTYAYYSDTTTDHTLGDLQSVSNAGQVTQYTKYNKHGQVVQIVDPNGRVTDIAYDLRLRLTRVSVGGQITSYAYDPAGQLTRMTLPDGSFVRYEYDDAHRLTAIVDSEGNRIDYTLDNAGKRTQEQVKDATGTLARSLSLSIDALGRVQQTTGEE